MLTEVEAKAAILRLITDQGIARPELLPKHVREDVEALVAWGQSESRPSVTVDAQGRIDLPFLGDQPWGLVIWTSQEAFLASLHGWQMVEPAQLLGTLPYLTEMAMRKVRATVAEAEVRQPMTAPSTETKQ